MLPQVVHHAAGPGKLTRAHLAHQNLMMPICFFAQFFRHLIQLVEVAALDALPHTFLEVLRKVGSLAWLSPFRCASGISIFGFCTGQAGGSSHCRLLFFLELNFGRLDNTRSLILGRRR